MNKILFFAAILIIGCNTAPKPTTIVVYDTLTIQPTRVRNEYNLPPEYEIVFDKQKSVYVVKYTFGDIPDWPGFLQYYYDKKYITICFTRKYASEFKKPSDAVRAIKQHHADVLADRRKGGKP